MDREDDGNGGDVRDSCSQTDQGSEYLSGDEEDLTSESYETCSESIDTQPCCVKATKRQQQQQLRNDSSSGGRNVEELSFLLECFFLSFGPECPQLGRNHPCSDPERYASAAVKKTSAVERCLDYQVESTAAAVNGGETAFISGAFASAVTDGGCRNNTADRSEHHFCSGLSTAVQSGVRSFESALQQHQQGQHNNDVRFHDDLILRELSEMRALLQRLLENRDLGELHEHDLLEILDFLPEAGHTPEEPAPHFPVGNWALKECGVCFETRWLYLRPCCNFASCSACLRRYYTSKVEQGHVKMECCNVDCHQFVHRDEISARLAPETKELFHKLLSRVNVGVWSKTCPRCNHVVQVPTTGSKRKWKQIPPVKCLSCGLMWCFKCHAPWHSNLTCRQFQKGDQLVKSWAKSVSHGQVNAQQCPKCKIYIQRTSGCDHMHCIRCKTHFCYRCGDRFRQLKFFGDHYSKWSIFGCKFRYKADKPLQRKFIRGTVFGCKVAAVPLIGLLALSAGVVVVSVGVFAFPLYGGFRLLQRYESHKKSVNLQPVQQPRRRRRWLVG